tara:strand:- start:3552 stop:5042 length:1491 start_codon:yes stop_codon:yes gene_type:complete
MKILTTQQIRALDQYTIENEPISPKNLMERAAKKCVGWFKKNIRIDQTVYIFCGPGNNGGDGLAISRLLGKLNFTCFCFHLKSNDYSHLFLENKNSLLKESILISSLADFPAIDKEDAVIVDSLFGSGLNRPLAGLSLQLIAFLNKKSGQKISIDIPSGMYSEFNGSNICFEATHTLTFQLPKLAFMLPEKGNHVGTFHLLPIQLDPTFLESEPTPFYYVTLSVVKSILKSIPTFAHKGSQGHLMLIGGQKNAMGALLLSGKASLYAGVGKLSVMSPKAGQIILHDLLPEAILTENDGYHYLEGSFNSTLNHWALGPSMGVTPQTEKFLASLLIKAKAPIVIDADALNILSKNPSLQKYIPPGSILTPHPKEFERWVGSWKNDREKLKKLKELSQKLDVIVILKGAYSVIATPSGDFLFNSSGNQGMATAGSGDVLTGVIGSLLAQKYLPREAAIVGVFAHGLAGDLAAELYGQRSVIASAIVDQIPAAFKAIEKI